VGGGGGGGGGCAGASDLFVNRNLKKVHVASFFQTASIKRKEQEERGIEAARDLKALVSAMTLRTRVSKNRLRFFPELFTKR